MTDNPYQWKATVADERDDFADWHIVIDSPSMTGSLRTLWCTTLAAAEDLAARINGQSTGNVRPDLLDGTNLIRHWLTGRTVDSVGLAAELRAWADTFQPTDLPDGASPWLGPEADAVALGHIVKTLPDDEWERAHGVILPDWCSTPNARAGGADLYLLRRKPQTVTVELPKDATDEQILAAAREALGR